MAGCRATKALADLGPPDVGDGSPELRTMNAVRVRKLFVPDVEVITAAVEDAWEPNEEGDIGNYEGLDCSRPEDYAPPHDGVSSHLAPHVRTMPLDQGPPTNSPVPVPSPTSGLDIGTRSVNKP